ncbi:hypothetical protein AG1IA_09167 [Rhizoctonia solani AG-1 IA]|uniref:Uncharacterized protein n=1 Tax=Thanatephorus cucumeris (strain AG1-IA) TaxID=983506 RepID=L8WFT7_THACA|nr:hypothetical protein AG1IA_09167 [Rhizoctonia solani AG-1 IA]
MPAIPPKGLPSGSYPKFRSHLNAVELGTTLYNTNDTNRAFSVTFQIVRALASPQVRSFYMAIPHGYGTSQSEPAFASRSHISLTGSCINSYYTYTCKRHPISPG